jgi:cytochrome bd-type quinol oxidase subunit 2
MFVNMKNENISKKFKEMGNLLIGQALFVIILVLLISSSESTKDIEILYTVGSLIQIIFFTAYVNWWFVTGDLFLNSEQNIDLSDNKKENKSQSMFVKIFAIIVLIILWIMWLSR